jgi:hypothetical protein
VVVTSGRTYEVVAAGKAVAKPSTASRAQLVGGGDQRFTANGDGSYSVRDVVGGLCMDVTGGSPSSTATWRSRRRMVGC